MRCSCRSRKYIERRRREGKLACSCSAIHASSLASAHRQTHTTAPSWAMRGKLQGGRTDKRTTRSLRARRVLRLAAADTDQNTAHFRQSGKSNVCCGMHAQNIMPENEGKRGRKLVYECVQVAPSRRHKINGFNAGAAPASESQGRRRTPGEDFFSRAKSFNY